MSQILTAIASLLLHALACLFLSFSPLFSETNTRQDLEYFRELQKKDPENLSHLFQIAETLKELNQYNEAILWYRQRLQYPGNVKEIWECEFGLGVCYQALENWSEALFWYLEAFQKNPTAFEPLLNIAVHYRLEGKNDLAHIFAKHGSRFVPSEDYRFNEELSIVSFYTRYREDGYKAINDLLLKKGVPWDVKSEAYRNLLYYIPNLKSTKFKKIEIELPLVNENSLERYSPMNPSICKTDEGYAVILRAVNYTQKGAKDFHTNDPDGCLRSRNFLLFYDSALNLLSSSEIFDHSIRERYDPWIVLGFEDCRLFQWKRELWFTASTRDTAPGAIPQIALGKIENGNITELIGLEGPEPGRCEKNWLPFVRDHDELNLIYGYDPFIIYRPNLLTGRSETVLEYQSIHDFSLFRGSAGPVPFDQGYLILVHEPVIFDDGSRCYVHRFLYTDKQFFIKLASRPFTFLHQGVEYCCSMTSDHAGSTLILALGIEDSSAYFCFVDLNLVRTLLCPL